jgi:hypothetical protein
VQNVRTYCRLLCVCVPSSLRELNRVCINRFSFLFSRSSSYLRYKIGVSGFKSRTTECSIKNPTLNATHKDFHTQKHDTNCNIELLHKYSVLEADAMLETGTTVISDVLSLVTDQQSQNLVTSPYSAIFDTFFQDTHC